MTLTKQDYDKYVKPFFDDLYSINLEFVDDILVGDFVKRLSNSEFNIEQLKKLIQEKTNIQNEFLNKYCKESLENLEKFMIQKDVK